MSVRSSLLSALCLAACGKPAPEADPGKLVALAKAMVHDEPPPGIRECKPAELTGPTMTWPTLLRIAQVPVPAKPEFADWINPQELDTPAARVVADPGAASTAARRAAAELLAATHLVVYEIDSVQAPIALGVKDLKRGHVDARAIRYEADGRPSCSLVFWFQNDLAKSDAAIAKSDRAVISPVVAAAMRDDLREQYLARVPKLH